MSPPLQFNDLTLDDEPPFAGSHFLLPEPLPSPDNVSSKSLQSQSPLPSPDNVSLKSLQSQSPLPSPLPYSALPLDPHLSRLSHLHIKSASSEWNHDAPTLPSSSPLRPTLYLPHPSQLHFHPNATSSHSLSQGPPFQHHSYLHLPGSNPIKIAHPQPRLARPAQQARNSFAKTPSHSSDCSRPALPLSLVDLIQDCFCLAIGSEPILSPSEYVAEFIDFVTERHCLESLNFMTAIYQYEQAAAQIADAQESSFASTRSALCATFNDKEPRNNEDDHNDQDVHNDQDDQNDSLNSREFLSQDESYYPDEGNSICLCSTLDQGYLSSLWQSIRNNFLQEGSPEEINLSQAARDDIANSDICCDSIHLQRAKREVLSLLRENVYMDFYALHRRQARGTLPLITGDLSTGVSQKPNSKQNKGVNGIAENQEVSPRSRLYLHSTHSAWRHTSGEALREHHHSSAGSSLISLLSVLKRSKYTRSSPDIESNALPTKSGMAQHSCCEVISGSPRRLWFKKLCHH